MSPLPGAYTVILLAMGDKKTFHTNRRDSRGAKKRECVIYGNLATLSGVYIGIFRLGVFDNAPDLVLLLVTDVGE